MNKKLKTCKCGHDFSQHQEYICPEDCPKCEGRPGISCDCESRQCLADDCSYCAAFDLKDN